MNRPVPAPLAWLLIVLWITLLLASVFLATPAGRAFLVAVWGRA